MVMMMMMMMMMMMNCFCGMVDRRKGFSLISSRYHCQRSSTSQISNTPRAGFEPAQNLSWGLVEWSCAAVITTTLEIIFLENLAETFKIINLTWNLSPHKVIWICIIQWWCSLFLFQARNTLFDWNL